MNFILRLFLTFSSVSYFIVVYLIHNGMFFSINGLLKTKWQTCLLYATIPVVLTLISLTLCRLLSTSTVSKVNSIETSNNDFLANYLAFFFVALSVNDTVTFWVVFGLTIVFTFYSRVSFFNPMLLVFGYNFFYIKTNENVKVMLISKEKLKSPQTFSIMEVRRINDYTFIEV